MAAPIGEQGIDAPDAGDVELARDRCQRTDRWIDLADWQDRGLREQQIAQRILRAGFAGSDPRQHPRRRAIVGKQHQRHAEAMPVTRSLRCIEPLSTISDRRSKAWSAGEVNHNVTDRL